ncbi:MAG TPA: Orn/Lys/Arg decarboxylase N-terminal domain-containing protein [Trebonia sp.]|jgi:arginine decarboxylase|nr:Orn/Lys/Arg decarboxylase N-terminal domain-containing protein [Trebonia sp.]
MSDHADVLLQRRVLVVDDALRATHTAVGRAVSGLVTELTRRGVEVTESASYEDGAAVVASDAGLCAVLVDWGLGGGHGGGDPGKEGEQASRLLALVRSRNATLPIFLLARGSSGSDSAGQEITIEAMEHADELVWMLQDTADFIAGRVLAAMDRYVSGLLPPFFRALLEYNREQEYAWAVPGHQGGVAYLKTPVGRMFHDFYGENLFRTDMGIERVSLGSLLDHAGPIGASEAYAARVFGAHRTYSGLVGTSGSNRAVMSGVLSTGDIAVIDRNCHKSVMQGLEITGAVPVYLIPSRNRYGIIGPIRPEAMAPGAIAALIEASPLTRISGTEPGASPGTPRAAYGVVTNCTYDGLCYDADAAQAMLERTTDVLHFDEAWYGYARFHPLYEGRFAMRGDPAAHPADGPTVFSTQSSHKLLAALSQASFIHVREGRRKVPHGAFNEAYMMHSTTSPLYPLIAANDVAASMMDGPGGRALVQETIDEAVAFRQTLARAHRQFTAGGDWFFEPWNAPEVTDPATGERLPFADAPPGLLRSEQSCWVLHPGEEWHGFGDIADGWCMLDPTKAGILAPGMGTGGELADWGVPAPLLTAYLGRHGIVPSRTTDHLVLCLFSVGITRGKWGTLLNALLAFKRDWDANAPLAAVLPNVEAAGRGRYRGFGLRDLGLRMWGHLRAEPPGPALQAAFATTPRARMTPREAYERLVRGDVELVPFTEMAGRTLAVGIQPYPPGIPILLPGEDAGPADGPFLSYLRLLQGWDEEFPGFEHEVEGAEHLPAPPGAPGPGAGAPPVVAGQSGTGHLPAAAGGEYAAYCVTREAG